MTPEELKNKPLVEVMLEIRWKLTPQDGGAEVDPHSKLLPGRLYDRVQDGYPVHEQLPAASVPDEVAGHVVQHRFRVAENGWPLIQIGPGILTLNDTAKYTWDDFRKRAVGAVERLFDAHPASRDLRIDSLSLRYIDAIQFDFEKDDVLRFLKQKMKVRIALPPSLFKRDSISPSPKGFNWQASFDTKEPAGRAGLKFVTGRVTGGPCLIWETLVQSKGDDVPTMPSGFANWLEAAHEITHTWFFELINGDLEKEFRGE